MRNILPILLAFMLFAAAGCGGAEVKKETYRLLPHERAAFDAYTNPNVVLYEEPEQIGKSNYEGKYIYLGWLARDGILPDNPFRDTKWNPYRKSSDPEIRKIDADMWWMIARRREQIERKKKEKASRARVISY